MSKNDIAFVSDAAGNGSPNCVARVIADAVIRAPLGNISGNAITHADHLNSPKRYVEDHHEDKAHGESDGSGVGVLAD